MGRRGQARGANGFTLIEVLMATAILAMVAAAIYVRTGDVQRQTMVLERRAMGQWLATDTLAELRLGVELGGEAPAAGSTTRQVQMASRDWRVRTRILATNHPSLFRVEVEVTEDQRSGDVFAAEMIGFVGSH